MIRLGFRSVFVSDESMPGIVTVDRAGRVLGWDDKASELFGTPGLDALGKPLVELLPKLGGHGLAMVVVQDASEHVLIQRVAHEINNPLAVVSANLDLMADEIDSPAHREMIADAREAVERMRRIVSDLRTSSRPPPSNLEAAPTDVFGRVLIVDDDPGVGSSLKRILRGHQVTVAISGTEALEILKRDDSFDVVLCDLMMPELTGMDLYRELSQVRPDYLSKIIFLTGGVFTPSARKFLEEVENERVDKPFDLTSIRSLVARYVVSAR